MSTGTWRRALERFETLSALPEGDLATALERLRAEEPQVHAQVKKLFDADRAAGDSEFLADPDAVAAFARRSLEPVQEEPDLAGTVFGPYLLIRELGSGGMGRVWLARRNDGLYAGEVAIKLLKAALATRGARERFAREGRILGALAHPSIARLLDAGTLDDGQLYLVLEFVEGERIDAWCEARGLDTRARVKLFKAVCDAVAFAHANLVVHRDLKPSNILVTPGGEVKLLDFGIAKLLDPERGESAETELTQLAGRALTPEYAAPEQVSGAPVTTATDVYSLGVVLYHLLAGKSPYQREDGSHPGAFELQREVLETEPRRLSGTTARKDLAGDLENIVAKALKKAPSERYASAQQLGEDLARYLENRPVSARADSAGYVLGKFVRRHRIMVAGAASVAIAIGAGITGVAWQAQVAREEGRRAQAEAEKAQAVSKFMAGMFEANSTANPDPAKARQTTARELLDIGRDRAAKDLAGNPGAHDEVLLLIGRLYYEIGYLDQSAKLDRERIALLRKHAGNRSPRLAGAQANLAGTLIGLGQIDEAMAATDEAIAILDAIGDRTSLERALAIDIKGSLLRFTEPEKALLFQREAIALYEAHHSTSSHYALSLRALTVTLLERGEAREAEQAITKAIAVGERAWGREGHRVANMHQLAGLASNMLFQPAKAEQSLLRAIEIDERALGERSQQRSILESYLSRVMQNGPRWRESRERLERVRARLTGRTDLTRGLAAVQVSLGHIATREGRLAEARPFFDEALPVHRKTFSKAIFAGALAFAAQLEQQSGRDAAAHIAELRELARGPLSGNKVIAARIAELEARQLLESGNADRARSLLQASLAAAPRPHPLSEALLQLLLAEAQETLGNLAEAERLSQLLLRAIEQHEDRAYFADLEAHAALRLGSALARQGRKGEALPHLERAVELRTERQHPASPRLAEARAVLAGLKR